METVDYLRYGFIKLGKDGGHIKFHSASLAL